MDRLTPVLQKYDYSLSLDGAKARVGAILDSSLPQNLQKSVFAQIIGNVDLTTLKPSDTEKTVAEMVEKINRFDDTFEIMPHPAAVCVYPQFVPVVKDLLVEDVEIAAVCGGFPASQTFLEVKIAEVSLAVAEGATEVDVVMPVGKVLERRYDEILEELTEIKSACRGARLKVILETGLLNDAELIKEAAVVAMVAGADFLKTSTGKDGSVASFEAVYLLCEAVAEFNKYNNTKVGVKVAGGVSLARDAAAYFTIVKSVLGDEWLSPGLFRIGASRLVNNLLTEVKGETVAYF